jgi:hypothetical protein
MRIKCRDAFTGGKRRSHQLDTGSLPSELTPRPAPSVGTFTRRIFPVSILCLVTLLFAPTSLRADGLPSRDPRRVLPLLAGLSDGGSLRTIAAILGKPDSAFVSGFSIYTFRLDDSTILYVTTPDRHRVFGIRRRAPGGNAQTLYEPLPHLLKHPLPGSAPF